MASHTSYCPRCDRKYRAESNDPAKAKAASLKLMEEHAKKYDDYPAVMLEDDKPATEGA